MTFSLILLAAGKGRRFGGAIKKQFLPFRGHPLYQYSLKTFLNIKTIKQLMVVVSGEDRQRLEQELFPLFNRDNRIGLALGGPQRHLSVLEGIKALSYKTDFVLIHDAARPLISSKDILTIISKAKATGNAVLPCEKVQDTIKMVENNHVLKSLNRESLAAASTPQCMPVNILLKGYQKLESMKRIPTDDAEMIFEDGAQVIVHWLESPNPKVTTPRDLTLLDKLL